MPYDPERHHRRSVRIPGYDYAQPGWYFVTVCTQPREPLFGTLARGRMRLSPAGEVVLDSWLRIDVLHEGVELDELFIMPDHLHGILVLTAEAAVSSVGRAGAGSLGMMIGQFKTYTTRQINVLRGTPGAPVWQRSFYEHVIRNDRDLERIREYIANNRWQEHDGDEPPGRLHRT
jgi:REP element-mobilizing transposase RayT